MVRNITPYIPHEQLLETLKVTLKEALEFNRRDALSAVGTDFREEQIAI
jgi:hypothetical protein